MPGDEGQDSWHSEIFGPRVVEMSIDLSTRPYSGGRARKRGSLLAARPLGGERVDEPAGCLQTQSLRMMLRWISEVPP